MKSDKLDKLDKLDKHREKSHSNPIVEIMMNRDGMSRAEAEAELRRVRAEFDPTADDPEDILRYEFGLEPDYIFDLLF